MIYSIHNGRLSASVRARGAELCSLRDFMSGREFLWQGDAAVWSGQSPLLFPVVGRLRDGVFRISQQAYAMPLHGFARESDFLVETRSADTLCFLLRDSRKTRAFYPFAFELRVEFSLRDDALCIRHSVSNAGDTPLPFCIGAHPGFFCQEGDALLLDAPETLRMYQLDANVNLLGTNTVEFPVLDGRIPLSSALFANDALIFDEIRSHAVTLMRRDGSSVRVEYPDAPCVGIWSCSKPPLRYVCIEPWHGMDDFSDFSGELTDKRHSRLLSSGERFTFTVRILPRS